MTKEGSDDQMINAPTELLIRAWGFFRHYDLGISHSAGPSWLDNELFDGVAQAVLNHQLAFGGHHLATVEFVHVKSVNGRAAFGDDARGGNVQRKFGERLRNHIKQAEAVLGFDLNQRARVGGPVVEINLRRQALAGVGRIGRLAVDFARDERRQVDVFVIQNLFEQRGEFVLALARREVAGFGVVDEKFVERDAIAARKNLRTENVQPDGAERAGDFAEQPGTIPGANLDEIVTAVGFILPGRRGRQHAVAFQNLPVHETVRQFEVVGNILRRVNFKIPLRQRGEMRVEFLVADVFGRQLADFLLQRFALFLRSADEFRAAGKQRHRALVQLPEQQVLEAVPKLVARALRIGERQQREQ